MRNATMKEPGSQPPLGRPPTRKERADLLRMFKLDGGYWVTGGPDGSYNCFSSALQLDEKQCAALGAYERNIGPEERARWDDPLPETAGQFLKRFGYTRRSREPVRGKVVALYDLSQVQPRWVAWRGQYHVARRVAPGWWESKLGGNCRIVHRLTALEPEYGPVVAFYVGKSVVSGGVRRQRGGTVKLSKAAIPYVPPFTRATAIKTIPMGLRLVHNFEPGSAG
ncbi:MAG: hypothetical protein E6J67_20105, partial [Deltaproteobacteria bacterium]